MNTHAYKSQSNKQQSFAKTGTQKQSVDQSAFQFVDNRPAAAAQRKLQEMAENSPQTEQSAQLQAIANNRSAQQQQPVPFTSLSTDKNNSLTVPKTSTDLGLLQREAMVIIEDWEDHRVVIAADGEAQDFKGGSGAKNNGWNAVDKYRAVAKVGKNPTIRLPSTDNNYRVAQAGHILAAQNGGDGGDPDNVFAQDGGVNNGPFRSKFENPMRAQLNLARDTDQVHFRVSLYGDKKKEKITQGPLEKESDAMERSDEESDFDGFSSDNE